MKKKQNTAPPKGPRLPVVGHCVATFANHIDDLVRTELESFGARQLVMHPNYATFSPDLEVAYRACLNSRLLSRVFWPLTDGLVSDEDGLNRLAAKLEWSEIMESDQSLMVQVTETRSGLQHTHHAALRVKDAIVDQFRERHGKRPSVDRECPDIRIHAHVESNRGQIFVDLSGEALHRRGYRAPGVPAPIKETIAAGVLLRLGWPRHAEKGATLLDPMCGSGTLLYEAALMAGNVAPGLLRPRFGFHGWKKHDEAKWQDCLAEAEGARRKSDARLLGRDLAHTTISRTRGHAAQFPWMIADFEHGHAAEAGPPCEQGIVVANPPHGNRLGDEKQVAILYERWGARLLEDFKGWSGGVFGPKELLTRWMGLRFERFNRFENGGITCVLARFRIR